MAPNDRKGGIPAWQRATSLPGAEQVKVEEKPAAQSTPTTSPEGPPQTAQESAQEAIQRSEQERETLASIPLVTVERVAQEPETADDTNFSEVREQAISFLNDPNIKHAPRERKVVFLRSKGLTDEEIELLLSAQQTQASLRYRYAEPSLTHLKAASEVQPPASVKRDVPPVITYPEFLVHSQKPPPLVTQSLLVNTAYVTAGLYGTLYALSKYIINPMQAQLSEARHDLFTETQSQLDTLTSRLSEVVTTVPPSGMGTSQATLAGFEHPEDEEGSDGDPTELFHRDFGTQTSPSLSRRNSISSNSSAATSSPLDRNEAQLKRLSTHLRELCGSSEDRTNSENTVTNELANLITNLNEMAYTSSSYYKYSNAAGFGAGYSWMGGINGVGEPEKKDDEIERLSKDIKALKGRFLGVKNFPRIGVR